MFTIDMRPKRMSDIFGLDSQKRILSEFIENFSSQKKKVLLFYGPVGSGKTSLVHTYCNERNYELLEINASDKRTAEDISNVIGNAVKQKSLFSEKKIVLIDEVDGIHGNYDRGGVAELIKIISETKTPIVMTCNDAWKSSLSGLRRKCNLVEFKPRTKADIIGVLRQACIKYGIEHDIPTLNILAEKAQGDVRAGLNDLQTAIKDNKLDSEFVKNMKSRNIEQDVFSGMQKIFRSEDMNEVLNTSDSINMDIRDLFTWLSENIPAEMPENHKMQKAFDYLSKGDIQLGRIRKQQYYRLFWYAKIISMLGLNTINKGRPTGWAKYSRPSRQLKFWNTSSKRRLRKAIFEKIAKECHTGSGRAADSYYLLLKVLAKTNNIYGEFFDDKELDFLRS